MFHCRNIPSVNGTDLKTARDRRGWTMDELAQRSGVSKATISRIEAGEVSNPSNDTVASLETALKLRRGSLVFGQVMGKTA